LPASQAASAPAESFSCQPADIFNRVAALLKQGNPDEAKEFLGRALKSNLKDPGLLRPLSELAARHGWFAEAVEASSKLLQINPQDAEALLGKAVCSAERGHVVLAGILLADLTKLDPQNAAARACLAALAAGNSGKAGSLLQYWIRPTSALGPADRDWPGVSPETGLPRKTETECAVNAV
jgi:Flp pilus assembly protein TadD